jgi:hypothetical protein
MSGRSLGVHYGFVVLSAPVARNFVQRLAQLDQAEAFAKLRRAHAHR